MNDRMLSEALFRPGVVRFGEFTLSPGRLSPYHLDLQASGAVKAAPAR